MARKFPDGEEVVHKSDRGHVMIVTRYTNDGKVVCRWMYKGKMEQDEFLEAELEKWEAPTVGYGDHQADIDKIRW